MNIVFANNVDSAGTIVDVKYKFGHEDMDITATLLLPITCNEHFRPGGREYQIMELLKPYNEAIWPAVYRRLLSREPETQPEPLAEDESFTNIFHVAYDRYHGDIIVPFNPAIVVLDISRDDRPDTVAIPQDLPQKNVALQFAKDTLHFGGTVAELKFQMDHPNDDESLFVLRCTVLLPTLEPNKAKGMLMLAHQCIKKAVWAGVRADWNAYSQTHRDLPLLVMKTNPEFEELMARIYPYTIFAGAPLDSTEIFILEWKAETMNYPGYDD